MISVSDVSGVSFLEGNEKEGLRPSQVFGLIQIVPQGVHRIQGPVVFKLSLYNDSQSRDSHWRHTLGTFSCWLVFGYRTGRREQGNLFPLA